MDALTIYSAYMTGVVALVGLWSIRMPDENLRIVFILALLWPLSLVAIGATVVGTAAGWHMDLAKGASLFGCRKATNPKVNGFAVTVFRQEFQFYSFK